jgi:hypothetical protein
VITRTITVTPDLAIKWLEGNVHNRAVRDSVVQRYARDMKAGRWRETHQGIAFDRAENDKEKVLVDGQHRLYAIVEADVPVKMLVSFGVPMEAQGVIDDNLQRTMVDVLKLAHGRDDVGNMHVAVAKRLLSSRIHGRLTREELVATLEKHDKAINFAIGCFEKRVRGITVAPVITVLARAFYSSDHARLTRFAQALLLGNIDEDAGEQPILLLRNWLLTKAPIRGGSSSQQDSIYRKTQRALTAYLDGDRVKTLYEAEQELFPLPNEKAERISKSRADVAKRRKR